MRDRLKVVACWLLYNRPDEPDPFWAFVHNMGRKDTVDDYEGMGAIGKGGGGRKDKKRKRDDDDDDDGSPQI